MIRSFRLALAQMNPTVGDIDGNTARILEYMERARECRADLVAFPELAITGYPPEDLLFKTSFLQANVEAMRRVVAAAKDIAVVVGYVAVGDSATGADIANAAAVGYDGQLIDTYRKMYLPNYGVFDEDRYFRRGAECPVYRINGVGVGVNICEDIWYPVGPIAVQREAGAELIVNINGSPFHAGKASLPGENDCHPRRRQRPVCGLLEHGGWAGRTGLRRRQPGLRHGRRGHCP